MGNCLSDNNVHIIASGEHIKNKTPDVSEEMNIINEYKLSHDAASQEYLVRLVTMLQCYRDNRKVKLQTYYNICYMLDSNHENMYMLTINDHYSDSHKCISDIRYAIKILQYFIDNNRTIRDIDSLISKKQTEWVELHR